MEKIFKNIAWILTILLILMVTQWGGVLSNFLHNKVIEHQHDTIIDIQTELQIDTLNTVTKGKTIRDTVIKIVTPDVLDTVAIINEFFKTKVIQTEYKDSNYDLIVTDTIAMNRLIGQFVDLKVYNKTITKNITTTIIKTPKINTAFYINADAAYYNKDVMIYLGGVLTHKKNIYGLGISPFDKSVKISIGTLIYKK